MPQSSKDAYADKQKRKAEHIADGYEKSGTSMEEAKSRAWATVNKQDHGGNSTGKGRQTNRSKAAKMEWETRRNGKSA